MNCLRNAIVVAILEVVSFGCTRGVVGGNPTGRLSDWNGTSQVFQGDALHMSVAITNAFDSYRYREMALIHTGGLDYEMHGRKYQGGYSLSCMSVTGTYTNISLDNGRTAPYLAHFYIEAHPVDTNRTKVIVYTIYSQVLDGQEVGVHGGWANHYRDIAPLRQEEENILAQIAAQVHVAK